MHIRYGERNKKRDQSLAQQFCTRFIASKNIAALKLKMQVNAISSVKRGDDFLYVMKDGSKLLDRVLVNEWQLFKG